MGWSAEQKQKTREKILQSASELFVLNGFDKVSIDDVMGHAGLTRGAFYAHYKTKSALYEEAITHARKQTYQFACKHSSSPAEQVQKYLSKEHVKGEDMHCPLAFLISDIQQQDLPLKRAYTQGYEDLVRLLTKEEFTGKRQDALCAATMMIGSVAISRALSDPALAEELLTASMASIRKIMTDNTDKNSAKPEH